MARDRRANPTGNSPAKAVIAIVLVVGVLYVMFMFVKGIFLLFSYSAPVFLILSLLLNRFVIWDFLKSIGRGYKSSFVRGLIMTILTIVGFPFVSFYLFVKSFMSYRFNKAKKAEREKQDSDYINYEEVEVEEEVEDFLELPEIIEDPEILEENRYDDLFE